MKKTPKQLIWTAQSFFKARHGTVFMTWNGLAQNYIWDTFGKGTSDQIITSKFSFAACGWLLAVAVSAGCGCRHMSAGYGWLCGRIARFVDVSSF